MTAEDSYFVIINFVYFTEREGMIFHVNHLPADDSHEISKPYLVLNEAPNLKMLSAANFCSAL